LKGKVVSAIHESKRDAGLFARLFGESIRVVGKKEPIAFKNVQGCF
jgi:hypothetical protein